ncbi:MAG: phage portal protein, partial [Negativibacillus sp.]|nr:phage portal protein [Negativibacillus sp.]
QWIAKGISWIDPAKEARANRTAMISYQTTLEEVAAEQGKDWREILEQRAKEEKLMKELGLEVIQDGYSKQEETTPQGE